MISEAIKTEETMFFIRNKDNNVATRNKNNATTRNKDKFLVSKQE